MRLLISLTFTFALILTSVSNISAQVVEVYPLRLANDNLSGGVIQIGGQGIGVLNMGEIKGKISEAETSETVYEYIGMLFPNNVRLNIPTEDLEGLKTGIYVLSIYANNGVIKEEKFEIE